jgi:hypothetical protein
MRDENFSAVIMKVEATEFIANGRRMILSVLFLCLFFWGRCHLRFDHRVTGSPKGENRRE